MSKHGEHSAVAAHCPHYRFTSHLYCASRTYSRFWGLQRSFDAEQLYQAYVRCHRAIVHGPAAKVSRSYGSTAVLPCCRPHSGMSLRLPPHCCAHVLLLCPSVRLYIAFCGRRLLRPPTVATALACCVFCYGRQAAATVESR